VALRVPHYGPLRGHRSSSSISIPSPTSTSTSSTSISPVYASHSHYRWHAYRFTHAHVYSYTYLHMYMYVYVACIPPVTGPGEDASPLYMYHTRWYISEDNRPQAPTARPSAWSRHSSKLDAMHPRERPSEQAPQSAYRPTPTVCIYEPSLCAIHVCE
jgi:hypothetical protein